MGNEDELREPEKKRPHLNSHSLSPAMARNSASSVSSNKNADAALLQYQNQKLVQQLDTQKHELQGLEARIKDLKDKQTSYDDVLIAVNQLWNLLVDDLVLLGVRAGGGSNILQMWDSENQTRDSIPSCPPEDMFLCRLLQVNSIERSSKDGLFQCVEEALGSRHSSARKLMKFLEEIIDAQRVKAKSIFETLHENLSAEDAMIQLSKIDDMMKEEAKHLHEVMEILHVKHEEYADKIQTYTRSHSADQAEIKRLAGDLEESMAELEESRRKLISLQMEKERASGTHSVVPAAATVNGSKSPDKKPADRMMDVQELKDSVEETKILAEDRLSELEESHQDNINLLKQMQNLQNEQNDDKYVYSSRLYNLVNDQLQRWIVEVERYKALTDSLQVDRSLVVRREKEVKVRTESADAARYTIDDSGFRIEQLEIQLQKSKTEKNDLELKMEEAIQDSGRKDIKAEFRVMASALSKEMGMMEAQLNRWKETADEALSLREKTVSLKVSLSKKTNEQRHLAEKCVGELEQIKYLKTTIEKMQKEKLKLQFMLDMYGQEGQDHRDLMEIKESERRAHVQSEILKSALDEHSLELRVKAAREVEAACQQRLSAAVAEIAELRAKLDSSERDVMELEEAMKSKEREAEAYITEMETIGQAFEDMQTQNQNLLQQVAERDDHNIKLVSESVKTKQAQSFLLAEKQAVAKQLKQVNALVESVKMRILHGEEQMKACLTEALRFTSEDRRLAINLETRKMELADAEKELKWLKNAVNSSDKEHEQIQRKADEIRKELEKERNERKKLEAELVAVNNKAAELTAETGEAAILKLQDEIKDCKSILKCGVCFDRPKEVVITKCFHLFCNPCIQRNLELRHRKCPGCGTAFGQSDVRFVKI